MNACMIGRGGLVLSGGARGRTQPGPGSLPQQTVCHVPLLHAVQQRLVHSTL